MTIENKREVAKRVLSEINGYCVSEYDSGHRNHLGASQIGHECKRYLFLVFRWAKREKFTGRKLRLFDRGHREEDRFIEWLRGIGAKVFEYDFQNNALIYDSDDNAYEVQIRKDFENIADITPNWADVSEDLTHIARAKADGVKLPQFRMSGVMGHYGGSLDCVIILPERYNIPEALLGEFKTNGTGRGFNDLLGGGVALSKPLHHTQMSCYGKGFGLKNGAYFNVNKNDDDMHVEIIELDHNLAMQMELKAEQIITAENAPHKLSNDTTFWKCKICSFHGICHEGQIIEKNCRSCKFAKAVENAAWHCEQHNAIIPQEHIAKACPAYKAIV